MEKEYCRQAYHLIRTPSCDFCKLKVIMEKHNELFRCTRPELTSRKSAYWVAYYMKQCMGNLAKEVLHC
jgi:hypothetical protein